MLKRGIASVVFILCCVSLLLPVSGQSISAKTESKLAEPFRILTSGKRITIHAKQNIKEVMVWTSNGHRLIEQKEINSNSYSFDVTIAEKIFFLRVDMADGKMFTKKIGIQ
jgi:hypothetical protein